MPWGVRVFVACFPRGLLIVGWDSCRSMALAMQFGG